MKNEIETLTPIISLSIGILKHEMRKSTDEEFRGQMDSSVTLPFMLILPLHAADVHSQTHFP